MIDLPRFTFINGPPESGKDTLARALRDLSPHENYIESFAEPIRQALLAVFWPDELLNGGLDLRDGEVKRQEMPYPKQVFNSENAPYSSYETSNTIRDTMISFSEEWMKARWGDQIFGKLALKRCLTNEIFYKRFIFADSGFVSEATPFLEECGPAQCLLIQLDRPERSFVGDSRSYIDLPGVRKVHLLNDGRVEDLLTSLQQKMGTV